jgi:hypothetical protein
MTARQPLDASKRSLCSSFGYVQFCHHPAPWEGVASGAVVACCAGVLPAQPGRRRGLGVALSPRPAMRAGYACRALVSGFPELSAGLFRNRRAVISPAG